jgi:hypothetical protein
VQSIGAGVRDASAYVIWALSRSLPKSCISASAPELANRIVCTALFDRELHVRRAASAAFQECVGRWVRLIYRDAALRDTDGWMQGAFPDGIAILAQLDYVAVGVRRYSFLHTAPLIAE